MAEFFKKKDTKFFSEEGKAHRGERRARVKEKLTPDFIQKMEGKDRKGIFEKDNFITSIAEGMKTDFGSKAGKVGVKFG